MFWGLVASMYVGNAVLLILNLPLVGMFVNLLRIPYPWLVPAILVISMVGVYSVNLKAADIWIMVLSGGVGYLLRKFGYEMAPLLLALVLGDRLEANFRLALTMSGELRDVCGQRGAHRHRRRSRPASDPASVRLDLRLPQIRRRPSRSLELAAQQGFTDCTQRSMRCSIRCGAEHTLSVVVADRVDTRKRPRHSRHGNVIARCAADSRIAIERVTWRRLASPY